LHVGLDLSRARLDVHVMDQTGTSLAVTTAAPDVGGLASLGTGWVSSVNRSQR
jgi:transposase